MSYTVNYPKIPSDKERRKSSMFSLLSEASNSLDFSPLVELALLRTDAQA